jgi:hypothetical protein
LLVGVVVISDESCALCHGNEASGIRRMSENLIDVVGLQVSRSDKKVCASCRRQNERQAVVSSVWNNLDTSEVPRLFWTEKSLQIFVIPFNKAAWDFNFKRLRQYYIDTFVPLVVARGNGQLIRYATRMKCAAQQASLGSTLQAPTKQATAIDAAGGRLWGVLNHGITPRTILFNYFLNDNIWS